MGSNERLESIKKKGNGILIYFVKDGKVTETIEKSWDRDIYQLTRKAIRAVNELSGQEQIHKLQTMKHPDFNMLKD